MRHNSIDTPQRVARKTVVSVLCALLMGMAAADFASPATAGGFHGRGFANSGHGFSRGWGRFGRHRDGGYGDRRPDWRVEREHWRPLRRRPPPQIYVAEPYYDDDYVVERPRKIRPRRPYVRRRVIETSPRKIQPKVAHSRPKPKIAHRPQPAPARHPQRAVANIDANIAPGEVLCEIKGDVPVAAVDKIARGYGLSRRSLQRVRLTQSTLYRYSLRKGRTVESVVARLRADKRIASAQPNMVFRLQDGDAKALAGAQYAATKLRLKQVHRVAKGDGVVVAVLDSGVDISHPELAGSVTASVNALSSQAQAEPHGTGIASVIAAHVNLVGMAPAARVLAVRAFSGARSTSATGTTADIVRAIEIAVDAGTRVVNMSFAGPSDPLLARVIAAASARGVIFVAAGGNAGPDAPPAYPAADPNVIAVTATDAADALFPAANRGAYIGVAAPGVDILVAAPGKGYALSSGTSVAAAHVSGLVALMLQEDSTMSPADARRMLDQSAQDLGPAGRDAQFGAGLIDPERAVEAAARAAVKPEVLRTGASAKVAAAVESK